MTETQKVLMERDGMTADEAIELMAECKEELLAGNTDAMMELLGLEDDYIFDLL